MVSRGDRFMALYFLWIWIYSLVGLCLSFWQTNLWLGVLFILIFLPIYHWNLTNVGVRNDEPLLITACSVPTILALSWLICSGKPTLSPLAAIAASLVTVGYSFATIEAASKSFGKKWAIALATFVSCLSLLVGGFIQGFLLGR
jgi:hypothetical protein